MPLPTRAGCGSTSFISRASCRSNASSPTSTCCPPCAGTAQQRRGPYPLHDHGKGKGKGRTFSVQLDQNVFQCFDARCGKKGDVIDLWAALKGLSLRDAAIDLVTAFNLQPAPRTEKRNG